MRQVAGAATPTLIGRKRERMILRRLIASAADGKGCIAMLFGEPGIGKTRLVQEAAALARAEGFSVCFGSCYEREGRPPYAPWAEILTQYTRTLEPGSFSDGEKVTFVSEQSLEGRDATEENGRSLQDFAASLGPLGEVTSVTQDAQTLRGGMTFRAYRAVFAKATVRVSTYTMPDGKLEQFLVAPE